MTLIFTKIIVIIIIIIIIIVIIVIIRTASGCDAQLAVQLYEHFL